MNMPPAPPRPSTRGPKIMTFSGIVILLVGVVAAGFAVTMFMASLPLNVVTQDGRPGESAIAGFAVSQEFKLDSPGATNYDLWEVQAASSGAFDLARDDVDVRNPDGESVYVTNTQVSGNTTAGRFKAATLASFTATKSGSYTITVTPGYGFSGPSTDGSGPVGVIVKEGTEFGSFLTGIFSTIAAVFIGIAGLLIGGGLTIGGGIWWATVKRRARPTGTAGPMGTGGPMGTAGPAANGGSAPHGWTTGTGGPPGR